MKKLFIVGCPRSGTTMVQQALNRHSRIVIPPETKFFFSFFGQSRAQQARHVERLSRDLDMHVPRPACRIRSLDDGRAFYDLVAQSYVERLRKRDVVYFGEKTPEHTGHLPRIRDMFPGAKVLVLYRDGRDVAVSLSRMPWMSPDLYVNFILWLYYQWVMRPERAAASPDLYFARYEDIVADPAKELGAILQFLDLPYEAAVAEGHGNREGIPEREYAWKARALEKISTERVGIYQRELNAGQIDALEHLGRFALPSLGYALQTDGRRRLPAGFFLKLSYNLARFVTRLPWQAVVREMGNRMIGYRASPLPTLLPAWS